MKSSAYLKQEHGIKVLFVSIGDLCPFILKKCMYCKCMDISCFDPHLLIVAIFSDRLLLATIVEFAL